MSSSSAQSLSSNSGDERTDHSSTMHKLIIVMNGGAIGLLQVTKQPTIDADRRATILSYWFIILIYGVLRVYEVKLRKNEDPIHYLVGHISHLFGALAALILIFMVSPIFTLIVAPLWLVWFFIIMYILLAKFIYMEIPEDADHSHQISPI